MIFTNILASVLCASLALASPVVLQLERLDVMNPHITSPSATTVWTVGNKQTITWDSSNIPSGATGMAVLGFLNEGDDNEHLMLDSPLAKGFSLSSGKVTVTVPDVPPRNSYILVLFGDSGNASPQFAIQGGHGTVSHDPTASPTASSGDPHSETLSPTLIGTTGTPEPPSETDPGAQSSNIPTGGTNTAKPTTTTDTGIPSPTGTSSFTQTGSTPSTSALSSIPSGSFLPPSPVSSSPAASGTAAGAQGASGTTSAAVHVAISWVACAIPAAIIAIF